MCLSNDDQKYENSGDYYVRLCSSEDIEIHGKFFGNTSLLLIDAVDSIRMYPNAQIYACGAFMRSCKDIFFNGIINNEKGECYFKANKLLHLQSQGKIQVIMDCKAISADNCKFRGNNGR